MISQLLSAGTAVIADVLDSIGLTPTVLSPSIAPLGADTSFAGPAYTIAGESRRSDAKGDREKLAAID
ncbi:MAG: hypothetical protein ACRDL8_07225, partial [Solirubrobacteraceae bacterium]